MEQLNAFKALKDPTHRRTCRRFVYLVGDGLLGLSQAGHAGWDVQQIRRCGSRRPVVARHFRFQSYFPLAAGKSLR